MTLKELKELFNGRLSSLYPTEELRSIFSILTETWLGYSRFEASLNQDAKMEPSVTRQFVDAISRLETFTPVQYITGETEFNGLKFKVDSNTLIPRPETEELVSWISMSVKQATGEGKFDSDSIKILDIGTGSGCIAVSLAKELPAAAITALDVSKEALKIAEYNAKQLGVDIEFMEMDITKSSQLPGLYQLIVSNPPYVRQVEKSQMSLNVLDHEPGLALFVSDEDPLLFYRAIIKLSRSFLIPGGMLFFEINEYLGEDMKRLLAANDFKQIELKQDFRGKDRMIRATKHG